MTAIERRKQRRQGKNPITNAQIRNVDIVPIDQWGRDHWSTFIYAMSRVAGSGGALQREKMRVHPKRHAGLAHFGSLLPGEFPATRLRDGTPMRSAHDDYDCLDDAVAHGLLTHVGTGCWEGVVEALDPAWSIARWMWTEEKARRPWSKPPPEVFAHVVRP